MSYTPYNHEKPNYFLLTFIVLIAIGSVYILLLKNPKLIVQTPLLEGLAKYEKPEDITTVLEKKNSATNKSLHGNTVGQVYLNKDHSYIADKEVSPAFIFPESWDVGSLARPEYKLKNNYLFIEGVERNDILINNLATFDPWRLSFKGKANSALIPPTTQNDFMYWLDQGQTLHLIQLSKKQILWSKILTQENIVKTYIDRNDQFYLFNTNGKELFITKYSKLDGQVLWTTPLKKAERIYKIQDHSDSLFVYGDTNFYRLDTTDGKIKWKVPSLSAPTSDLLVSNKHVFIATSEGQLYSLKINNGEKIWEYNAESPLNGNITFVPIYNRISVMSDNGYIHTLDAFTGERRWRLRLQVKPNNTGLLSVKLNSSSIKNLVMDWGKKGWTLWGGCGLKSLCIFSPTSGQILAKYYTSEPIISMPLFFKNKFALLLKNPKNENHPNLVFFVNPD